MAGRMTVCNMSIEAGARAGMIAPDTKVFDWLRDRPLAPQGAAFAAAVARWATLKSDPGARHDRIVTINAASVAPMVSWGTSPEAVLPITGVTPDPATLVDPEKRAQAEIMLAYMGLAPNMALLHLPVDAVFYWKLYKWPHRRPEGSCGDDPSRLDHLCPCACCARLGGGQGTSGG